MGFALCAGVRYIGKYLFVGIVREAESPRRAKGDEVLLDDRAVSAYRYL